MSSMSQEPDLAALRALAEAAVEEAQANRGVIFPSEPRDIALRVAANPQAILALIARCEAMEARAEAAEAAVARVRVLPSEWESAANLAERAGLLDAGYTSGLRFEGAAEYLRDAAKDLRAALEPPAVGAE